MGANLFDDGALHIKKGPVLQIASDKWLLTQIYRQGRNVIISFDNDLEQKKKKEIPA